MATYVLIEKEYEDINKVVYNFGPSKDKFERLEIIKETEEYYKIETGIKNSNFYYLTALSKIMKHNKNNPSDKYPDKLIYAS